MRHQPAEVMALALLEFSAGLLNASRQVVALQIDCETAVAERDAGRLQ